MSRTSITFVVGVVISLGLVAPGCSADRSNPGGPLVAVLDDDQTGTDDALLLGELTTNSADCVVVIQSDTKQTVSVLWPPGTTVDTEDGGDMWTIDSPALEDTAKAGDQVQLQGGFRTEQDAPAADIYKSCRADEFFLVSPFDM